MQGRHRVNPDPGSLWNRSVPCESEPSEEAASRPGIMFYTENGRGGGRGAAQSRREGDGAPWPGHGAAGRAGLRDSDSGVLGQRVVEGQATSPPVSPAPPPPRGLSSRPHTDVCPLVYPKEEQAGSFCSSLPPLEHQLRPQAFLFCSLFCPHLGGTWRIVGVCRREECAAPSLRPALVWASRCGVPVSGSQ